MRDVVVGLFDDSGNLLQPWVDAGYECYVYDILNPVAGEDLGRLHRRHADLRYPLALPVPAERIAFVSCHPPCDNLAVSGARWFKGKGLRVLSESISMFATAAEFCEAAGAPYMIENPMSTISTYWRKPDHIYSPYEYSGLSLDDNYTKSTCLWTGNGFVMPGRVLHPSVSEALELVKQHSNGRVVAKPKALALTKNHPLVVEFYPDNRIHALPPGPARAYLRSVTPKSFGRAVFEANAAALDMS